MLFGRSLFETVLTRMEEDAPPPETVEDEGPRIRGFSTGFVAPAMEGVSVSLHRIDGAYRDFEAEEAGVPEGSPGVETAAPKAEIPPMPPHLARVLATEIAEDLGLHPTDTVETLNEKRRAFARLNHPDIVHMAYREAANLRMMTANLLIDQAITRILAAQRLGLL